MNLIFYLVVRHKRIRALCRTYGARISKKLPSAHALGLIIPPLAGASFEPFTSESASPSRLAAIAGWLFAGHGLIMIGDLGLS